MLDGGGAEGVRCPQHHIKPITLILIGKLADGGGFAHAIDPDDEDHVGLDLLREVEGGTILRPVLSQERCDLFLQQPIEFPGADILILSDTLLDPVNDLQRRLHTHVTGDEYLLELIEYLVIHPGLTRHGVREFVEEALLRLLQTGVQCLFLFLRE